MAIDRTAIEESLRGTLAAADQMIGTREPEARHTRDFGFGHADAALSDTRRTRIVEDSPTVIRGTVTSDSLVRDLDDPRLVECMGIPMLEARVLYLTGTSDTHPAQLTTRLEKWGLAVVLDSEWRRMEAERGLQRDKPHPQRAMEIRAEREAERLAEHPHHPDKGGDGFVGGCPDCWLAYGKAMGWVQ